MNTILQVVVVTLLLSIAQVSGKLVRDQHDCKWTAADGSKFDLTNLIKHAGDGDYVASSPQYKYYMNVCGDTTLIPHQCKKKSIPATAPAYQVFQQHDNNGGCYYLGDTKKFSWDLMDETNAQKGVTLTYSNGEKCGNGHIREIRYHFVCAHGFSKEESVPLFVQENQDPVHVCHYNVTWPTRHGCPLFGSAPSNGGGDLSHFDLLFYPGLSVILWTGMLGIVGFICAGVLQGGIKLPAGPTSAKAMPKRRVIDNVLPDNFDAFEEDGVREGDVAL